MLPGRALGISIFCLRLAAQVFPAADPVLPASRAPGMQPLTPAEYQKFAASSEGHAMVKVIRHLPPGLSPNYRLGYNFVYESANHGWILDRDSEGYKLYLDLKGDGDMTNAEPLRFNDSGGVSRIDVPMKDSKGHWITRFELVPDPSGASANLRAISSASRSGKLTIDGREIPFRLAGSEGHYDRASNHVLFDPEGNGKFESYGATERWVNLAGKTYEFHIDPQGETLTLTESDSRPDRPSLKPGSPVPNLSLADLEGNSHSFRRNTADLTLLEFWNTSCGPCREEMPKLKLLYDRLPRTRFEILGVSSDESPDVLKKYLAGFSIAWPECPELDGGPVHRLMRVEGIPAYFLLSKNGEILDRWVGSGPTISKIEAALK